MNSGTTIEFRRTDPMIDGCEGTLPRAAHLDRLTTLGELAAGLSHELAQPLLAAHNFTSAALSICRNSPKRDPVLFDTLNGTQAQLDRAIQIASRIHNFIARRRPTCEEFELNKAVQEAMALLPHESPNTDIRLKLGSALPTVYADAILIQQVIVNLLRNAMDASTSEDGEVHDIEIETALEPEGYVRFSVSDHGPGIAENALETIFVPFHSSKSNGLGLGLSLSRTLIEANEGRIWAENRPTGGARFSFVLPIANGAMS